LLHIDQVDKYKTFKWGFKWKLVENKLKVYEDKGKLGEEK